MVEGLTLTREGKIAILTLDRPDRRNAFTRDMRMAMISEIQTLNLDEDCRAVVLTGAGGHFSAGADISNVGKEEAPWTLIKTRENMAEVHQLVRAIVASPKLFVAAVEGLAFGGGFALAAACDQVIAAKTARFGAAFCKLGLIGDMGLMWSLKERVGLARAKRIILLGNEVSGEEAGAVGLADEAVETGEALAAAVALANRFVAVAPLSVAYTKASYARGIDDIEDAFACELDYVPILNRTEDFKTAIAAFQTKTRPVFTGR
ncbi:enoyl-CoA hydratase/isomerase family protein [Sphingosinicella ginsenosidimutans]|uniref:Enoyl-CoA hydratase/isomerase family protein n=1 Tax=Allosphingosinicella ginsenosidimutans TaxID=1176539 RepID=A0A5C6TQT0_9SPHN|nr:enoyl-CoA hydratase/isomerase family protein [Sphingosinicella ginsenosidimutans]TXC62579.1 enoyl-CoA hydratase/isomerase family protein [Sphingosinicella ginsenosidimutans]